MAPRPILLVHGGWGRAWAWERVVPGLDERCLSVDAVNLPLTSIDDAAREVACGRRSDLCDGLGQ